MATDTVSPAPRRGNDPARARTFAEAAESYLASGGEGRYLEPILAYFEGRSVRDIFPFDVREMAEILYPSHSASTRNRCAVGPTRAVLLHAYDRGWADLIRIRRFKEDPPKRRRPASQLWLALFCRRCDADGLPHLAALVLMMATTGARISEAVALRWSEVDLSTRKLILLKTKTSTNSERALTDEVAERLRAMQPSCSREDRVFRYTSRFSVSERIKAVCDRAGIPYKPPHTAGRHAFATTAIELGVDVVTAMRAGGWKSSKVFLETYVHPRTDAARLVADRMSLSAPTEL